LRSFPEILAFFSQPYRTVVQQLQQHRNPSSARLSDFLNGGSHNAETVMASILGALNSLLAQSAMRVMGKDELRLKSLFRRPVCIHVEISEPLLETYRPLVQMLARCLIDALIANSESLGPARRLPTTVFFDDMPSLGRLLSVERLLTLRSRAVGIVAGVQSINSLELAYGPAYRSLLEAFANKIVLPGCAQPDADYFSHASGETFVALPTYEGQQPVFSTKPLLSSAEIRRPPCEHVLLGSPVTLFFGNNTFQAYLQRAYELPAYADVLRSVRNVTGRERLRRSPRIPAMPTLQPPPAASSTNTGLPPGITNTAGWSDSEVSELLNKTRANLDWDQTTGSARKWWEAFESENKTRLPLVLRLAEELQNRKATITEFFLAYVYSNTDNIQANLSYLDYTRLKKEEEQKKKKQKAQAEPENDQKRKKSEDEQG
ncbi:MAG: Type secretory system Conjugative transfer, partial [Planctomycetota bacterium]